MFPIFCSALKAQQANGYLQIMSIMQDPVMNAILQQAQSNPAALQEHLKNPQVRSKIQKLIAAGVIRMGH